MGTGGHPASTIYQNRVDGFAFRQGADPGGTLDTLYAVIYNGVYRFSPGAADWERICATSRCGTDYMEATKEGYLLIGAPAGPAADGERSTDGGQTWEHEVVGVSVSVLFQSMLPALGGRVYACNLSSCQWSFDGGAAGSWVSGWALGGIPAALGEVQPSAALPDGRLLGGAWNGAVYSGDGGETWTPSALWGPGSLVVSSLTFAPDPSHPFGGVAYAGVRDFNAGRPAVYRSDDAGQTWALVLEVNPGDYDLPGPDWIEVVADPQPGGALYAGIEDIPGGTTPSAGPVLASFDGGQTWTQVADSTNGWGGFAVNVFEVGRDGRLYAGTDRGVWRTVEALPVANESEVPEPAEETGAVLEVAPNPFRRQAEITVTLDRPAEVQVVVYDVLGRRVALLAEGRFGVGRHEVAFNGAALPSGVYLVRMEAGGVRLTRTVTLRGR